MLLYGQDGHLEEESYQPDSIADLDKGEALWDSDKKSDQAWILSDRDVWYANPNYKGLPMPHPEYEEYEENEVAQQEFNPKDTTDYSDLPF